MKFAFFILMVLLAATSLAAVPFYDQHDAGEFRETEDSRVVLMERRLAKGRILGG
jgi:hypothetical protein